MVQGEEVVDGLVEVEEVFGESWRERESADRGVLWTYTASRWSKLVRVWDWDETKGQSYRPRQVTIGKLSVPTPEATEAVLSA